MRDGPTGPSGLKDTFFDHLRLLQLAARFRSTPFLTKLGPDLGITSTQASNALIQIKHLRSGTQHMAFWCYLVIPQPCPSRIAGLSPHPAHQVPLGHLDSQSPDEYPAGMINAHQSPTQQTFLRVLMASCFPPSVGLLCTRHNHQTGDKGAFYIRYHSVAYSQVT